MPTRRERQREELIAQIKTTARQMMAEEGTAGVSIRAIAKRIGMTPPAIHYYFKNVDDLITTLLVESFEALVAYQAETIEANAEKPYAEQFYLFAQAYRQWALENSIEFQLIYGNPIPGYEQPTEITYPPARRGFAQFAGLINKAVEAGSLTPPETYQVAAVSLAAPLAKLQTQDGHDYDPIILYITAALWARFHGLVTLELYNLIQPVIGDTAVFFHNESCNTLTEFGFENLEQLEKYR